MNTLQKDLRRQVRRNIHKWAVDSLDLYRVAGLGPHESYSDILSVLLNLIVSAAVILEVPQDEFLKELEIYMNDFRKTRKARR
jgi:ABC-type uncharacterized transport system permease subunit